MATLTAGAGSTTWTAAAFSGGAASTAADEIVVPTGASLTISAANTVLCRSLSVTGTGTLIFAATTSVVNIGDATAGTGNVALSIASGATITLTGVGTINYISTSATVQTITTGGKTLPNETFNASSNGSWQYADNHTSSGTINLTKGTLDTANNTVTASIFSSNNSNTRTLTLGSSAITLTANNTNSWVVNSTNLTIASNTAVVSLTGTGTVVFNTQNNTNYNGLSVVFTAITNVGSVGGPPTTAVTLKNLTFTGTAIKTAIGSISGSVTCTGTFTANGESSINRLLIQTNAPHSLYTITAETVSCSNVDFTCITGAGGGSWNLSAITGGSGDCGGNTGITFTPPTNRYRVGNTTSVFSDSTYWSTTSGGAGGASVPLPQDTAYFDANSVSISTRYTNTDMPRIPGIDCTGYTGTLYIINNTTYGSYKLGSSMVYAQTGGITFSGRGSHTITMAGNSSTAGMIFNNYGGTYTNLDAMSTTGGITHLYGTWDTNNQTITAYQYSSVNSNARNLTLGTSTLNFSSPSGTFFNATPTNLTLSASSATIVLTVASASARSFSAQGVFGTLDYTVTGSTGSLTIIGNNTFDTLNFSDTTNARSLLITAGTTQTINNWNVNGTVGKLMTIDSVTDATHTLSKSSGVISSDYLSVKNSVAGGGATWYAGANSTNVSGNSGWIFTAPPVASSGAFFAFM